MSGERQDRPKIIVDDDWKSRVQAEKEQAAQAEQVKPVAENTASATSPESDDGPLPPASMSLLISSLATQALMFLGQIPEIEGAQPILRPNAAKHSIDLLGVLEQKTKGNLSAAESSMLTSVLNELRMAYVAIVAK